jgi:hypothetical protein
MKSKLKPRAPRTGEDARIMYDLKLYGAYDLYKQLLPNTRSDVSNRSLYAMVETAKKAGVSLKDLRDYGVIRKGYTKYEEQKYRDRILDDQRYDTLAAKGAEYINHLDTAWALFMKMWRKTRREDERKIKISLAKGFLSTKGISPVSELIDEFAVEQDVDAFDLRMYAKFSGKGNLMKEDYAQKE